MNRMPPPLSVRHRSFLLGGAVVALALGAIALFMSRSGALFPAQLILAFAGIGFVWANGAFWWLEHRHPQVEETGDSPLGPSAAPGSGIGRHPVVFFGAYVIGAVIVTWACIRLVIDG